MRSSSGRFRPPRLWRSRLLLPACVGLVIFLLTPHWVSAQTNAAPIIVGQQPLQVSAGHPLAISLSDLEVVDTDDTYPDGFTLRIAENAEAFQVSDNTITLRDPLEGSLEVTVVVNDGTDDSDPYTLTVDVIGTTGKGGKDKEDKGGGDNPGEDKGGGKKDEGKKNDDKKGEGKDDKKGGGKKDDEKKNDDKKDKDDKDDKDKKGDGKDHDHDKGGPKDDEGKGKGKGKEKESSGAGKDQDDNKGGGKKDDTKKGDDKKDDGKTDGNPGGGNNGNGNNGGGNSGNDNNGGGNGKDGTDNGETDGGSNSGNNGANNNGGGNGGLNNDGDNNEGNQPTTPPNVAPVITGQREITTAKDVAVTLDLNMLEVDDPDNTYPSDFSLRVLEGNNYTLDHNTLTPASGFTGTLGVRVQVNDGIANSNTFTLNITVKEGNIPPQIIGQTPLATDEETPLSLGFDDLIVFDPDSRYPENFSINLFDGEHHTAQGRTITPRKDFSGTLTVMVTVDDGKLESDPYRLAIAVNPVNDAPVVRNIEREALPYVANAGPANITERIQITDADGDNIVGAQISFDMASYQSGHDLLSYEPTEQVPIEGVFDAESGTLYLIGSASVSDYQAALRSITYSFYHENAETVGPSAKTLTLFVRDANTESNVVDREIAFSNEIALDVPRAFTPNGDMANDTWHVTPLQNADQYDDAITRVYTIRGQLLYEASGFEWEWDGRYEGQDLPTGTYYYIISIKSGVSMSNRKGIVTIVR